MSTAIRIRPFMQLPEQDLYPQFVSVEILNGRIVATLSDDRVVSVPLWWSWRLEQATPEQRSRGQIIGAGHIAYWPDVDEHLSVAGFLRGAPAPRPAAAGAAKR